MGIQFRQFAKSGVLAGAVKGSKVFSELVSIIDRDVIAPKILYLDFNGVETASASFLRESVFAFKDYLKSVDSNLYPVVANVSESIVDELKILTQLRSDVVIVCKHEDELAPTKVALVGELDSKQELTFRLLIELGEADAISLAKLYGKNDGITNPTAWNNRLAALFAKRIIFETNQGRMKKFKPLFKEIEYGR
jgi:hypothetical protein